MDPPEARTPTIRKFNPGTFQSDEEIVRQFVVREPELNVVLNVLRDNVDSPSCQHILVMAPRGRGKTMLLARIAAELRIGGDLSQHLLPVRFMEESQEVLDIADFWLETLFHLSREIAGRDPELARELRAVHTDLATCWQGDFLAERARAAVLDASDRLGRKLVLMVENLQTLCADVDGDFGWQLRAALQTVPRIILLSTATSRFERLDDVREPFFGLFRILELKPLDTEACRRLWHIISGDEVAERNIRPLEILTGGSPRLLVIVAEFARHCSIGKLMEELVTLVDDHTEYFRSHLEVLAPTERRVYLAVIDLWQFSTANEIAARARMDIRKASSLLGRLIDRGAVIVQGRGRKREYAAAERLCSIYYKLRRERDEATVVRNLIRFMVSFYDEGELKEMSDMFSVVADQWPTIREDLEQIGTRFPHLDFLRKIKERTGADSTSSDGGVDEDGESKVPIAEVVPAKLEKLLVDNLLQLDSKKLEEFIFESLGGDHELVIANLSTIIECAAGSTAPKIRTTVAMAMQLKGCLQMLNREIEAAINSFDELIARFSDSSDPVIQVLVSDVFVRKTFTQSEVCDVDEILATFDEMIKRPGINSFPGFQAARDSVFAKIAEKGFDQFNQGEFKASVKTLEGLVQRFGNSDEPGLRKRIAYAMLYRAYSYSQLDDSLSAIAALDEIVERFGHENVPDLGNLVVGVLGFKAELQIIQGRSKEALQTCDEGERRLRRLYGDKAVALPEKSIKTDRDAPVLEWQLKSIRVDALLGLKRREAALEELRSAYAIFNPANELMMRHMLKDITMIVSQEDLGEEILEILASDREKAEALNPLFVALNNRLGDKVRAPAEVLEVADDIVAEMNKVQPKR